MRTGWHLHALLCVLAFLPVSGGVAGSSRFGAGDPVWSAGGRFTLYELGEYDLEGNRTKVTYPSTNRSVAASYDPAGRLSSVSDGTTKADYEYDRAGNVTFLRRTKVSAGSVVLETANTFDPLNRLTRRVAEQGSGGAGSGTIYDAAFGYDLAGNIRTVSETVGGQTRSIDYDYDDQYRLTEETWGGSTYRYDYDAVGNRLEMREVDGTGVTLWTNTYVYASPNLRNELDRIDVDSDGNGVAESGFDYTWDVNGNLEAVTSGDYDAEGNLTQNVSTTTYEWDTSNRLTRAVAEGVEVFRATYDYRTRRQSKTESGQTTYFVYDGGVSIAERPGGTASTQVEYVYGGGLGAGIGGILFEDRAGVVRHSVYNQVGHTVAQTDEEGASTGWTIYDAFGDVESTSQGGLTTNRLANTRELDASLGFYNHGYRYYDPLTGRYISRDPAGYVDGPNLYVYVSGNPVIGVDPEALWGVWLWGFHVGNERPWLVFNEETNEAFRGGVSVTTNTLTFGASDKVGLTDSSQYQGSEYIASRLAGTVAREALIGAGTVGLATAVNGGSRVARAGVATLTAVEVATGGYEVGSGAAKIAEGEYVEGTIDVVGGGMRVAAGFAGARALNASKAKVPPPASEAEGVTSEVEEGVRAATPASAAPKKPLHGNTRTSTTDATLYGKFDKDGNFQKWGISKDAQRRYTSKELDGGFVKEYRRGPRDQMLDRERRLTERFPGPQNKEPWAGKRNPSHPNYDPNYKGKKR